VKFYNNKDPNPAIYISGFPSSPAAFDLKYKLDKYDVEWKESLEADIEAAKGKIPF